MSNFKKKAFFVISNKGGVGKTQVAKLIAEKIRGVEGAESIIFDGDPGVQGLSNFYGIKGPDGKYDTFANRSTPSKGVLLIDARGNAEAVSNQLNYKADYYLNDFPGGLTDPAPIFGDAQSLIEEYNLEGIEVVVVIVVGSDQASSAGVIKAMKEWGPSARFVIVKNLGQAERDNFMFLEGEFASRLGHPAKSALAQGAVIAEMPKLDDISLQTLEALELPFGKAIENLVQWRERVQDEADEAPADFRPRIRRLQKFLADSEPLFATLGIGETE